MNVDKTRIETDRFGLVEVPAAHYWGAQTQRSLVHFAIGSQTMPLATVRALAMVKRASAAVNRDRANEIHGAARGAKQPVHPNDHVNLGQSSNDCFPET